MSAIKDRINKIKVELRKLEGENGSYCFKEALKELNFINAVNSEVEEGE